MNEYAIVSENEDLKKYTTLGVGGTAKYLLKPTSEKNLVCLIKYLEENNIKYFILGNGSNLILDDSYFDGAVIKLSELKNITFKDSTVEVESGVMLGVLSSKMLDKGYVNFAFASLIPGTIGGSIKGNAGAYKHDIFESLVSVKVLKDGKVNTLLKEDISYGYRHTNIDGIIVSAKFNLEKGDAELARGEIKENNSKRMVSQPISARTFGSTFKNPEGLSSGKLIDDLGLKGFAIGGARISPKHANFIENFDNATFDDVVALINTIKDKVKKEYDVDLELEGKIIRWEEV